MHTRYSQSRSLAGKSGSIPGNKYHYILLAGLCLIGVTTRISGQSAQRVKPLSTSEKKVFRKYEDSLKRFSDQIVYSDTPAVRLRSDSLFVRSLVRALKNKNSFYYPFDSLQTISRLYAPDSSFRILTWQFKKDDYLFLQEGAIQVNQPDGSLKLFPLFDVSMFTGKPLDSVRTRKNWIGAIYYRIILKTYNGANYYTLLGFDDYSQSSNKKWMEVLTFTSSGEPAFGGPFISFQEDSARKPVQFRFSMEYKKEASTHFNYDPDMDMIVFDHLIPEGGEAEKKDSYIPDGDFEGFTWKNGKWVHVDKLADKLFNFKLKDGEFPMDEKILDESGNSNEQKLMDQSEKNLQKKGKSKIPPGTVKDPVKKPGNQ